METGNRKAGFTVVELMIGMIASAMFALAAGALLFYFWAGWRNSVESIAMQRDAMVALRVIEHRIRNARPSDVGGLGSYTITFANDADFSSGQITPDTDVVVQSFSVQSNNYGGIAVAVALATARGADLGNYEMTIYPRN